MYVTVHFGGTKCSEVEGDWMDFVTHFCRQDCGQGIVSVRATGVELQEIPQLIMIYEIWLQPTSRRFLRKLDEVPGGNNLYYIL